MKKCTTYGFAKRLFMNTVSVSAEQLPIMSSYQVKR